MKKINLICPINKLSYGYVGSYITDALIKLGIEVSLFPINQNLEAERKHHDSIRKALEYAKLPDFHADCVRIYHQFDMSLFAGNGDHIGFPIFELDAFNGVEKHHLDSCDKIFVCSDWAKDVVWEELNLWKRLSEAGGHERDTTYAQQRISNKVQTVPLGVDTEIFYPAKSYRKSTVFLNCGKWEVRKGHDVLIKAFCKAFRPEDDVELWMMPHNPFNSEEENKYWVDMYKNSSMGHKIKILPQQESQSQIADIMRQADVGVFPFRAEGWCMPLLEIMSCGKTVICSKYSGATEYLPEGCNYYIVPCGQDFEKAEDGKWFHGQGNWMKISDESVCLFANSMILAHQEKQKNRASINEANVEVSRNFTWKNTAEKFVEGLQI